MNGVTETCHSEKISKASVDADPTLFDIVIKMPHHLHGEKKMKKYLLRYNSSHRWLARTGMEVFVHSDTVSEH